MRRIRRNNLLMTKPESVLVPMARRPNGNGSGSCCPPTIPQRVCVLENEVADINVTLAEHTCELNNHECRIEKLENTSNPCPSPCQPNLPYPYNNSFYPMNQNTSLGGSGIENNIAGNSSYIDNSTMYSQNSYGMIPCPRPCPQPCPPPSCTPFFPPSKRPPIIFDGYSISFRQVYVNGTPAAFWFLIPETSASTEVYRFSLKTTSNKYVYEPVDPMNFSTVYPPSSTDGTHITYIYDNVPGYGFGLRPYLYLLESASPHTIIGYQYIEITYISPPSVEWDYVPLPPPSTSVSIFTPYTRSLVFTYAKTQAINLGITYYNTVDPTAIDPTNFVNKYPINITSPDLNVIIPPDIAPIGPGVAFILPFDTYTYQVSFSANLKINTETIPVVPPQPSINYLQGSGYIGAQPAIAQLVVYQLSSSGVAIDQNPSASLIFTWSNIAIDPTIIGPPPNNFKVFQEPDVTGQPGAYYQGAPSNVNPVYNVIPILDTNGRPLARRLVTIAVTQGFSFSEATLTLIRLPV